MTSEPKGPLSAREEAIAILTANKTIRVVKVHVVEAAWKILSNSARVAGVSVDEIISHQLFNACLAAVEEKITKDREAEAKAARERLEGLASEKVEPLV